ncbi:hypothetical protein, partial [Gilvimarinus sp. 1_MG-2023]|uniref:hypothetical protein n=1 Tax=Gilvimarinus sp. 1_MG-2023 TaxID=3062638 RepID=UPI0026E14EF2
MNIIVVGQRHGESRTYRLTTPAKTLLFGCLVALPFAMGMAGFWLVDWLADEGFSLEPQAAEAWENDLSLQRQELEQIRVQTNQELQALTVKLAELQSRLMRLDALGERLVSVANLEADEFDFSMAPALGGPKTLGEAYEAPEISDVLNDLANRIGHREQQLEVLDDLMSAQRLDADTFVTGRSIKKGWMSSRYGRRTDPFTGQLAWHGGVDLPVSRGRILLRLRLGLLP